MSVGIGSKSKLAFAIETTYGTFPTSTSGTGISFLTETLQNTRNTFTSQAINPNRQVGAVRSGNVSAGGDINMELSVNILGEFLKHLLCVTPVTSTVTPTALANSTAVSRGSYVSISTRVYLVTRSGTTAADATTNPPTSVDPGEEVVNGTASFQYFGTTSASVYKHVFQGGVVKPTGGFAVEREVFLDSGSQFFRYIGGRINTMALTVPQEGIVTCNFGFIFLDLDSVATATIFSGVTTPVDEPFAGSECAVQTKLYGAGSYAEDFSISGLTLNVTNNFDTGVYGVHATRRRDLPEGQRAVTGTLTALFEDMTKFNYFKNESILSLEISFNHLGMFMRIEMPEVKLTGGQPAPQIGGNGVVTHSFDFSAFKYAGAGDIKVELYNTTSAYA